MRAAMAETATSWQMPAESKSAQNKPNRKTRRFTAIAIYPLRRGVPGESSAATPRRALVSLFR